MNILTELHTRDIFYTKWFDILSVNYFAHIWYFWHLTLIGSCYGDVHKMTARIYFWHTSSIVTLFRTTFNVLNLFILYYGVVSNFLPPPLFLGHDIVLTLWKFILLRKVKKWEADKFPSNNYDQNESFCFCFSFLSRFPEIFS